VDLSGPLMKPWVGLKVELPLTEPHPAPLVSRRPAREVEIPSAARSVRKLMEGHGWMVRPTYALGWTLSARGKVGHLTHSLALRAHQGRDRRRVVAVWEVREVSEKLARLTSEGITGLLPMPVAGWKFDLAYGWGAGQPIHRLGAEALKAYVRMTTVVDSEEE
jgi:hypothetical protein